MVSLVPAEFKPVVRPLLRRPDLWSTALRAALELSPRGWWRRYPYLPRPDPDWMRFRLVTAYGGDGRYSHHTPLRPDDVLTWLEWRRSWSGV